MLIIPVRREIWRPFYAYGAIALVVALVGLPAAVGGSSAATDVVLFIDAICLALAGVRTLVWRLLPARVTVSYDDSGLFVRRSARLLRHYPWTGVQQVFVSWGDRWPEWNRWAAFAQISVVSQGERRPSIDSSPGLLLVRPRDVEQAERNLEAVLERYVGDRGEHGQSGR
ncbi:MAG: hypothetical protein M3Q22_06905 [Actinomycetota bacterium]|nr:hypothetical protein [Actinomycetota bacterium]